MAQTLHQILVHAVFHKHAHAVPIRSKDQQLLNKCVVKVCQQLQCPCLIANGVADHEHFLFVLSPKRAVAEVMKEVKRMSSLYLKYHDQAYYKHFCWQAGYGAFGVSVKLKEVVYDYISHQQEHHKRMDMRVELTALLQSAQVKNYDEALYWEKD